MFQKTPEHFAIENAVISGHNTIVEAGPGSGKTTTISEVIAPTLLKTFHGPLTGIVGAAMAFNGKNANGLKVAINSPHITCGTVHSLLGQQYKAAYPFRRIQVETKAGPDFRGRYQKAKPDKMVDIAEGLFPTKADEPFDFHLAFRLVSLMKANAFGIPGHPAIEDKEAINQIVREHGLLAVEDSETESESESMEQHLQESIDKAIALLKASNAAFQTVNFDDMLYLSMLLNIKLPDWKFIMYDEGQDIKPIELEFLARMAAKGCQIVIVGDAFQAINQFTGCMAGALTSAKSALNALEMPLRTSYRASHAAAELANSVFPNSVIPWSGAKQGSLEQTTYAELCQNVDGFDFQHGVLSRTHKNLIGMALSLLAKKIVFSYKGISELVTKMERMLWHASKASNDLGEIRKSLTEYQATCEDKFIKPNGTVPAWVSKQGETTEALTLLLAYCQGQGFTLEAAKRYLKDLGNFDKPSTGPCLSTLHAAKGMQWENVYLIGALTSPLAKSEEQLHAEKCLTYVAYSRSSDKVITVEV